MRNIIQRILVALVAIPALLWLSWDERFFLLFWGFVFLLMNAEYWMMFAKKNAHLSPYSLAFASLMLGVALIFQKESVPFLFFGLCFLLFAYRAFRGPTEKAIAELGSQWFGLLYAGLVFAFPGRLIQSYPQQQLLFWLLIFTWLVDTSAYTVGMLWGGKHRGITPSSPNKSLEGFIGGLLVPLLLVGLAYGLGLKSLPYRTLFALAFIAGTAGQLGDLMESLVKRDMGVKDSSQLIPGHGGVLDRFDSFVINATVAYFLFTFLEKGCFL